MSPVFQTAIASGFVVVLFVCFLEFGKDDNFKKGELNYVKCSLYIAFHIFYLI